MRCGLSGETRPTNGDLGTGLSAGMPFRYARCVGSRRPSAPVLVVEDNAETRDVLRMLLEINGYAVEMARDGSEAIEYLRAGYPACLIILDLRMPIMDGWILLRVLQADPYLAEIPAIAFSAFIEGELPGTIATVRKASVNPDVFLGLIERACIQDGPPEQ